MSKVEIAKRINAACQKLNTMNKNVTFKLIEEDYAVSIECSAKNGGKRFSSYEFHGFFDEYKKKITAYENAMTFIELIIAASNFNDPKAYHNMTA